MTITSYNTCNPHPLTLVTLPQARSYCGINREPSDLSPTPALSVVSILDYVRILHKQEYSKLTISPPSSPYHPTRPLPTSDPKVLWQRSPRICDRDFAWASPFPKAIKIDASRYTFSVETRWLFTVYEYVGGLRLGGRERDVTSVLGGRVVG